MPPRHSKMVRGPILPPRQAMNLRALGLALLTHLILLLVLVLGLDWKTEANGPLQIMLVAEGNSPPRPTVHSNRLDVVPTKHPFPSQPTTPNKLHHRPTVSPLPTN